MVGDPIADFLVRLQNASMARKERVTLPASTLKRSIAEILAKEGYLADISAKKNGVLTVSILYKNSRPAIEGFKRMSKPGRRMYMGVRDIRPVKRGRGLLVLSTPQGVLTGQEAKQKRVGGEALFEIW